MAVWAGLSVVVLASRIGFVRAGFGTDPDAHRLAIAARAIRETGHYVFSREPGHPVQELIAALLFPLGPSGLNGATAVMSVLTVLVFARVATELGLRGPVWLALGVAFTPLYWVHSVDSMDFVWAMALGWLGFWLALRERIHWAGLALGLAIGCRITEGFTLLPAVLLCGGSATDLPRGNGAKAVAKIPLGPRIRLVLVACAVGAACYLPVALVYGAGALRVYESGRAPLIVVMRRWWLEPWGIPGALGLCAALLLGAIAAVRATSRPKAGHVNRCDAPVSGRSDSAVRTLALAAVLPILGHWLLFIRLPHDAGYVLSTVPWILLLIGLALPRIATHVVVGSLLLSNVPIAALADHTVWGAHERRRSQVRTVRRWIGQLQEETGPIVLVAGTYQPKILSALSNERLSGVEIRYVLGADEARRLMGQGKRIYFLSRALELNRRLTGLDLPTIGARPFGA
jgi:hypothetical protein